ncbi:hypothetical protein SAMN04488063_3535 [Halopelagius inordinatus]|uniref:Uncharacterized protein n=1 Tax=Halopelagius inordinatus TaxID=553467 RepID=A0A1I2WH58_9EURY|nr:hypothetical protein [Halopelagius inordinatus]SFH00007.1 hypothetical protein SAMN04488063_3535 [Halopelagius inordinatus]
MRRALLVLAAVAVLLTTSLPTGGFTAAQADRSVSVAVVDDSKALLGVELRAERRPPESAPNSEAATGATTATERRPKAGTAAAGRATASPAGREGPSDAPRTVLSVTLRNRLPDADSLRASVHLVDDGVRSDASTSLVVRDEATTRLSNVDCEDTVRIVARAGGTRIELDREVPCERGRSIAPGR